jgi:hypothetical protein
MGNTSMSILKKTLQDIEADLEWHVPVDVLAKLLCTGLTEALTAFPDERITVEIVHGLNEMSIIPANTVRIISDAGFLQHEIRMNHRAIEALGMVLDLTLDDLKSAKRAIKIRVQPAEGPPVLKALAHLEAKEHLHGPSA